ncbi:MAG: hypothetical protein WCK49_07110 [Myxococcaceae bacterium]
MRQDVLDQTISLKASSKAWFAFYLFCFGIFTASLFTLLASVFLAGEAQEGEHRKIYQKKSQYALAISVISGASVFLTSLL